MTSKFSKPKGRMVKGGEFFIMTIIDGWVRYGFNYNGEGYAVDMLMGREGVRAYLHQGLELKSQADFKWRVWTYQETVSEEGSTFTSILRHVPEGTKHQSISAAFWKVIAPLDGEDATNIFFLG